MPFLLVIATRKMGGSGVVVTDINDIVRAHLGQYAEGKFGQNSLGISSRGSRKAE